MRIPCRDRSYNTLFEVHVPQTQVPVSETAKAKRAANQRRWRAENLDKCRKYDATFKAKHPDRVLEKMRKRAFMRMYGITLAERDALIVAQHGLCASCGDQPGPDKCLHVDHSHATGAVRGMLCMSCNLALGHLKDDPERITSLLAYIINEAAQ